MKILRTGSGDALELMVEPYAHQAQELLHHWNAPARALPWQMRTGKSMVPVVSAAALWQRAELDAVLVVAPSRVHHAWALDEFPRHCAVPFTSHSWICQADGTKREVESLARLRSAADRGRLPVLSINREALLVPRVWRFVRRYFRRYRTMLIVDESHHYGGAGTKGTRRIRAVAERCPFRRILSGTMIGNCAGRLYSQFQILEKGALGYDTAKEFLQAHAVIELVGHHWRPVKGKWKNLELIRERMRAWGTPIRRADCEDLPPVVTSWEYHEITPMVRRVYDRAMKEAKKTDPPNYTDARKTAMMGKDQALREILPDYLSQGPVIVWAPFRETVDGVAGILQAEGLLAAAHHGGMSHKDRARAVDRALEVGGVLVSTPDSLAEGADLSRARSMIWYAPPWDVIPFDQARERCTAMGGEATAEVLLVSQDTIEEGMFRCLEKKRDVAEWFMEMEEEA